MRRLPLLLVAMCFVASSSEISTKNVGQRKLTLRMEDSVGSESSDSRTLFSIAQVETLWLGADTTGTSVIVGGVWDFDNRGTLPCPVEDGFSEYIKNGVFAQGWTSEDIHEQKNLYWHAEDFSDAGFACSTSPINGTFSAWCGVVTPPPEECWQDPPGYGEYWDQWLCKTVILDGYTPRLRYTFNSATESGFDYCYVIIDREFPDSCGWVGELADTLRCYDGLHPTTTEDIDLTNIWASDPCDFVVEDWDYSGDTVKVCFVVVSDGEGDDEDGLEPTCDGAFTIDDIIIDVYGADDDTTTFEDGTIEGWQSCGGWSSGDYAAVRDRNSFVNNDPCGFACCSMEGCVLTFYDPNIPGQYGYGGHFAGRLFKRAWSPPIYVGAYLSTGYILSFDLYGDLPIPNWIYYRHFVRYKQDPICWSPPLSDGYTYYAPSPQCTTKVWDFSGIIPAGADSIMVGLSVWSGCLAWGTPCTNGNESPIFDNIRVGLLVEPACEVTPTSLDFGSVGVGADKYKTFTIKNRGGGTLNGTVSESCDNYSIVSGGDPYSLAPGESLVVTVRFAPTSNETFPCTIETGDALCSDVSATGVGVSPMFVVSPSSIDFGRMAVDSTQDTSFTIKNIGLGTLDVNVSEPCSLYSILSGGGAFSLAGGESLVVDIRFTPTVPGRHDCIIETNTSVWNRLALVADGSYGLQTIDVGDPTVPTFVGTYNTPGEAMNIYFSEDLAFVADYGGGLQVFDIGNPAAPTFVGEYDTYGNARGVYVTGNHAFVADGWLQVIDISDPATPILVGTYETPGLTQDVHVSGDHAFVATYDYGLQVIDISDPADPTMVGSYIEPGCHARDVYIVGNHAYVADDVWGLQAIDVSNPTEPTISGTCSLNDAVGVHVLGDYAFVADYYAGLKVIDITNPASPTVVGSYDMPDSAMGVYVLGGYAFVSNSNYGLQVIDVSTPSTPTLTGNYDTPGYAKGVTVIPWGDVACTGYAGYSHALIDSVIDVPNDQGGHARIYMTRSIYDFEEETQLPIVMYTIYRRADSAVAIAVASEPEQKKDEAKRLAKVGPAFDQDKLPPDWPIVEHNGRLFVQSSPELRLSGFPPGAWEIVYGFGPTQQQNYVAVVPTTADSSQSGIPWEYFIITAHTTTPSIWFTSPIDSGYSVDNIAPGVPEGFVVAYNTGSGNQLTWDPSPEPDFQYYRVYRGDSEDFIPGPGNLVHETATEGWTDPEYDGWDVHYKITTLDHAGNESDASSPETTTGITEPRIPKTFALHQNVPNPFNPTTTIMYDVPESGGQVTLRIYDVSGRLVRILVNKVETPGEKRVTWNGRNDRGSRVATGVYFYRMTAPGFEMTKKMVLLQ